VEISDGNRDSADVVADNIDVVLQLGRDGNNGRLLSLGSLDEVSNVFLL